MRCLWIYFLASLCFLSKVNPTFRARVITAGYLDAVLYMTEHPDLSGAVVDLRLGKHNALPIFRRLPHKNIPFVVHTGYPADHVRREWPTTPIIQKPAA